MQVTVTGRFPVVSGGTHPLRSAVDAWRERTPDPSPETAAQDAALAAAQADAAAELLAAQERVGVDVLGDGYVPIYDEWFAWAAAVTGVRVGGPIRYLDTNTYYHRWELLGRARRRGAGPAVGAYRRAVSLTRRPVKPCVFGPYTLWACAVKRGKNDSPAGFDALADIWAEEIAELGAAGARTVQLDESIVLRPAHRGALPFVRRALERIAKVAPGVALTVHFACGAVGRLLQPLLDLPVAGIGLDFTDAYRESNLDALRGWHGDKLLQAGIANAREIRIELPSELQALLAAITACVPARHCVAAPSTGLHYLPRHAAFEKLAGLVRAAHAFDA